MLKGEKKLEKIFKAISSRRSVRKYKPDEIPIEKLYKVIESANWAPSDGNSQPWHFYVLNNEYVEKVCEVFYAEAKEHIPKASYIPDDQKEAHLIYAKNLGGAPTHIVVSYRVKTEGIVQKEEGLMAASAVIQNLMLAAWAEALGTVWVAGNICHSEDIRKMLNIKENEFIAGIIPIGFPAVNPPPTPREDFRSKITWLK